MQKTVSLPFMLLGILFNVCLVASNLLETKVIQLGPITATAGLIVFPISYIINDCIAEVWGFKKARLIIWSGFAMNFLTIGFARSGIYFSINLYQTFCNDFLGFHTGSYKTCCFQCLTKLDKFISQFDCLHNFCPL